MFIGTDRKMLKSTKITFLILFLIFIAVLGMTAGDANKHQDIWYSNKNCSDSFNDYNFAAKKDFQLSLVDIKSNDCTSTSCDLSITREIKNVKHTSNIFGEGNMPILEYNSKQYIYAHLQGDPPFPFFGSIGALERYIEEIDNFYKIPAGEMRTDVILFKNVPLESISKGVKIIIEDRLDLTGDIVCYEFIVTVSEMN